MRTALMVSPHADDAAAFCGGTLAKLAAEGWKVIIVRVTDDCKDSVGMTLESTREKNAADFRVAAKILGAAEVIELGYVTDRLADESLVGLRERMVYLFRKRRPYAVFSFDPYGLWEDNQDHVRVAQAVYEAFWVSAFDLHHPEHFAEGLKPFSVCERWFFGRELPKVNYVEDVTDFIGKKVEALSSHEAMIKNMLARFILQLDTWGRRVKLLEECKSGDHKSLINAFMEEQAKGVAATYHLGEGRMGEAFRLERFGDLEGLFQLFSEPIEGREPPPKRKGIDGGA